MTNLLKQLSDKLWKKRGGEYKIIKIDKEGREGIFSHAPLMDKSNPHKFKAIVDDVLNTSFVCSKCDRKSNSRANSIIAKFLDKKKINYKKATLGRIPIFIINYKGKRIGVVYLDSRYFINMINPTDKNRIIEKKMKELFDNSIILTHLDYKSLLNKLIRGMKDIKK